MSSALARSRKTKVAREFLCEYIFRPIAQLVAGELSSDYYISPDRAWEALLEADLRRFERRVSDVAGRLELDDLSTEVLWLCAAPELDERYGRVFAYLLDGTARRLPTPRLIASLLERSGHDPEQVLARLGAAAPLRRLGCVRLVGSDAGCPLIDHPIRLADELTAFAARDGAAR